MRSLVSALVLALVWMTTSVNAAGYKLIAWNDLGMHCTDGVDYSVFGVLPPYNTVNVQLVDPNGRLVHDPGGITVTYRAVADATGSVNTTSVGKTNFWTHVRALFGTSLAPDVGLTGSLMPGAGNAERPAVFNASHAWFEAVGVPITPFDDAGATNYYPMMRFTARDAGGAVLATTDVVLPVSDEMDCNACHASGGAPAARPAIGWAWDSDPARDVKLNVLAIHDQHQVGNARYRDALVAQGYASDGLRATALSSEPILCARCHPSNALPGLGVNGIQPLTAAIHSRHSDAVDPTNGLSLESSSNRGACYRCHPGAETRCLRGAMGAAVRGDATFAIQCQSCHGSMSAVGAQQRVGWLQEPACQNCHTGTATSNAGQIRFSDAFASPGVLRTAANDTFATNANTPAAGLSLYRFSTGHGGLQCEACHGATHAEYSSTEPNDNVQSVALQGHAGVLAECNACHTSAPSTVTGGPHGLHPLGATWVSRHGDVAERGTSECRACHGADYRGTVLSRALGPRHLSTEFGTKDFWQGFQVGCYACHDGPDSESDARNRPPVASNGSASTGTATAVSIGLRALDADSNPLTLRIVSRPGHGRAGIAGTTATYVPDDGFSGSDTFTFAAWDGWTESNLATVTVAVATAPQTASLTVTKSGSGGGLVTSAPAAINCGGTCTTTVPVGSTLLLSATPDQNSRFDGWSGACGGTGPCTVTVNADAVVNALFTWVPMSYTLTVTKTGTGRGVVKSAPQGIECGSACSGSFPSGSTVTLTATPESTSTFSGWTGACTGTGPCVLSMNRTQTVGAGFATRSTRRRAAGK